MTVETADRALAGIAPADWAPYAAIGTLLLVELVAILALNGGMLVYTLDDPYIHLALAENIARGHYGINLGEASAPSSSILWPFLLVPFAGTAIHDEWPLVLNLASAFASIAVLQAILGRAMPPDAMPFRWLPPLVATLAALLFNLVGLVFTGMEHSLQVLLALAVVLGLLVEAEERRVPWFLVAAIVIGPLVRYENLAVSAGALVHLALRGRIALAMVLGLATVGPLAAFSAVLRGLGLEWLPSSVLIKVDAAPADATLRDLVLAMARSLFASHGHHFRLILLGFGVLFLWRGLRRGARPAARALAAAGAVMVAMHLAGGKYGWFGRYEPYVLISAAMLAIHLWRDPLSSWLRRQEPRGALAAVLLPAVLIAPMTAMPTLLTPAAARNIHEQQYQMHRFVTEFAGGAAVAVNDLGWVGFRNDGYVLDLWGLGSVEAGARRLAGEPGWMDDMATRRGVRLAMLYEDWFPGQIPAGWVRLGTLRLGHMRVTAARSEVAFYAANPAAAPELGARLAAFARTLPEGVVFAADSPGG